MSDVICNKCGKEGYHTNYMKGATKSAMDEFGICFTCAFWTLIARGKSHIIIDGGHYAIGGGKDGGMGGRKFRIQLNDGKIIETHDLWYQGEIPEHFRDELQDNAKFIDGAGRYKSGGTTCFNPSN